MSIQQSTTFSFHGGIHPPENKVQSLTLPIGRPTLPNELVLPLGQHIGQASRPVVSIGNTVRKGQVVAINNGFLSSCLHAPTSGTLVAIESRPIAHPSGLEDLCMIIHPDGLDAWGELTPLNNWRDTPATDVLAYLAEMGIVGMGGAGFPTQVKLQGAHKKALSHLIINAAECEPYITADDMLIREKTTELVRGIEILQFLVKAEQTLIGIEDNKPQAITALVDCIKERGANIQVVVAPTKYPSGGEKQLIKLLTNKEVPSGRHPADIGVLCQNVGTCVAIHDAIYLGHPLISRVTTLTGDALRQPQNVEVLLGTPVSHLMQYAGLDEMKLNRLVMGGPMMGFTLDAADVPIVKTTNCLLAASRKELPQPAPEQPCIRCGMCEQACPAELLPQQLLWFAKSQEHDKAQHFNLFDCIECGACSYVCPSSIPLVQYYRHSKSEIRQARESSIKADHAKQRFEARKARMEAEAAEKEAKRFARTQSAAATKSKPAKPAPKATDAVTTSTTGQDDSKKLKVDIAIGKTKLKKLQKALLTAQESEHTEEIQSLQLQIQEQEATLAQWEQELSKITTAPTASPVEKTSTAAPAVNEEAKKAKIDVALATAKLKKAQKQLAEAPEDASLQANVQSLQEALAAAQKRLTECGGQSTHETVNKAGKSETASVSADDQKKLKIDIAIAKAAVKKVEKAIKKAEELNAPELDTLQQQLNNAQRRVNELESQLQSSGSSEQAPTTTNEVTEDKEAIKKHKIAAALAKAQINKLKRRLDDETEDKEDLAKQIADAEKREQEANAELDKLMAGAAPKSEAKKQESDSVTDEIKEALKKQKVAAALAKAKIAKLKRRLENEPDNQGELETLIAEAEQQEIAANAELAKLTNTQE